MDKKKYKNWDTAFGYAEDIVSGKIVANKYRIKACQRFLDDVKSKKYDFDPKDAEFVIRIIENTFCHQQGEEVRSPGGSPDNHADASPQESFHKQQAFPYAPIL